MTTLTANQLAFVDAFMRSRSGPDAYREAYKADKMSAKAVGTEASRLLAHPEISREIEKRTAELAKEADFTPATAARKFLEIAFADPNELISLKIGACRYCYGDGHKYQWKIHEYEEALTKAEWRARRDKDVLLPDIAGGFGYDQTREPHPDCPECMGEGVERLVPRDTTKLSPAGRALYGGAKQGKNGIEVFSADRMKALENATRIVGGFQDKVKLDGTIKQMTTVVDLEKIDPAEAERVYMEMIRATSS